MRLNINKFTNYHVPIKSCNNNFIFKNENDLLIHELADFLISEEFMDEPLSSSSDEFRYDHGRKFDKSLVLKTINQNLNKISLQQILPYIIPCTETFTELMYYIFNNEVCIDFIKKLQELNCQHIISKILKNVRCSDLEVLENVSKNYKTAVNMYRSDYQCKTEVVNWVESVNFKNTNIRKKALSSVLHSNRLPFLGQHSCQGMSATAEQRDRCESDVSMESSHSGQSSSNSVTSDRIRHSSSSMLPITFRKLITDEKNISIANLNMLHTQKNYCPELDIPILRLSYVWWFIQVKFILTKADIRKASPFPFEALGKVKFTTRFFCKYRVVLD